MAQYLLTVGGEKMQYFTDALKKYTDFDGRATRTQYWMFVLFYVIFYVVLAVVTQLIEIGSVLPVIYSLALLIPSLSIAARRLHDTGRSGWWQLLVLIPLIGGIVLIIFYVTESQGDNQYGPRPTPA
jgi:uncharacterized membrane protein YhaH (DUF805 family)